MTKSLKGSKTEQNLLKSFAGESQARNRYEFFASVAKKEGYELQTRRKNMQNVSLNSSKAG